MKKIIVSILAVIIVTNIASAQKYFDKAKISNKQDSLSYSIGVLLASNMAKEGIDYDATLVGKAFRDVAQKETWEISAEDANTFIQNYFQEIEERTKQEKVKESDKFFAENAKKEGVVTTESGLQYKIIKKGNGKRPCDTCDVSVHYEGRLIDGTVFDTSYDQEEPITLNPQYVIQGMSEGILLMDEGSQYELYIPWNLAYGEYSPAEIIPAYSSLVFTVDLVSILYPEDAQNADQFDDDGMKSEPKN